MLARALILATLAASLSSCGGSRVSPDATGPARETSWFCQPQDHDAWECVQSGETTPRPRAPAPPPTPPPAAATDPNVPTMAQPATEGRGDAPYDALLPGSDERPAYQRLAYEPDQPMKLTDLPGDYYAVQVVALKSERAVDAWVKERELTGMSVARIAKDEQTLYVVLLGVYPDRAAAQRAVDERPPPLRDLTPWIRKLSSLQAAIRAAAPATD